MRFSIVTSVAAIMLTSVFAVPAQAKDVVVGVAGPFTGAYATFGEQFKRGADMALVDINEKGGVLGQKLKFTMGDDACDPKQAVTVANKLAAEGVPLVIGHFCSGSSIPASSVYTDSGMLMISPGSTNPQLTDAGNWNVFRVVGRDDAQGIVGADYIAKHFKDKKIAVVHDKQTYSKGLADNAQKRLKELGITPAMTETVNPGERDYSAFVTKLKTNNIDVLFYGGYHTEAGLIIRQMREQGLQTVLVGGDALASKEFWAITGNVGKGTIFTFGADPRLDPANKELVARFKKAGYDPEGYTIYTYAALKLWVDVVNKIGDASPKKVADALRSGTFKTAIGELAFDSKGDIKASGYRTYVWNGADYQYAD